MKVGFEKDVELVLILKIVRWYCGLGLVNFGGIRCFDFFIEQSIEVGFKRFHFIIVGIKLLIFASNPNVYYLINKHSRRLKSNSVCSLNMSGTK